MYDFKTQKNEILQMTLQCIKEHIEIMFFLVQCRSWYIASRTASDPTHAARYRQPHLSFMFTGVLSQSRHRNCPCRSVFCCLIGSCEVSCVSRLDSTSGCWMLNC